jgi:hypothetical protein
VPHVRTSVRGPKMVFSNALTCGMSEPRSGFWPIGETLLSRTLKTLVGFPGFPVELVGVGGLHAAFLNESRTRGSVWRHVQEIRVAHLLRPRYALIEGHPSYSFRLCYDTDSAGTQFGEGSSHADSLAPEVLLSCPVPQTLTGPVRRSAQASLSGRINIHLHDALH